MTRWMWGHIAEREADAGSLCILWEDGVFPDAQSISGHDIHGAGWQTNIPFDISAKPANFFAKNEGHGTSGL